MHRLQGARSGVAAVSRAAAAAKDDPPPPDYDTVIIESGQQRRTQRPETNRHQPPATAGGRAAAAAVEVEDVYIEPLNALSTPPGPLEHFLASPASSSLALGAFSLDLGEVS